MNLAASSSSSSLADAGGKRAPGIKMIPLGKEGHRALLSIFIGAFLQLVETIKLLWLK